MKKTIIVSDLHLNTRFDPNKFKYLENLFARYDSIILNGDFWSYYSCTFDEFVNSEWNKLFKILKDKTIYIYGNHDLEIWNNEKVSLFSKEQRTFYSLDIDDYVLQISHGHEIKWASLKNENFIKLHRKMGLDVLSDKVQSKIVSKFGTTFYNNLGKKLEKYYIKKNASKNIRVVGHLHAPEFLIQNSYINTGYINYGNSYFLEISENELRLVHERY